MSGPSQAPGPLNSTSGDRYRDQQRGSSNRAIRLDATKTTNRGEAGLRP